MNRNQLYEQLLQPYDDLRFMATDDKEQVRGIAVPVVDAVLAFAREQLPTEDPLPSTINGVIPTSRGNG